MGTQTVIDDVHIIPPEFYQEGALVVLAGRWQDGAWLAEGYQQKGGWDDQLVLGVTPTSYAWYPLPMGMHDQQDALDQIPESRYAIDDMIETHLTNIYGIGRDEIILVGFSAGGVMALEVAAHSPKPFRAVVCHSGAILDTDNFPNCIHRDMPILLTHHSDDDCFDWIERYWPMRSALKDKGYNVHVLERFRGGHVITDEDVEEVHRFIKKKNSFFEKL